MKCLYCGKKITEVMNSRAIRGGFGVWRRRRCVQCGKTFTTKESSVADNLFVIKRNGSRQRFVYEKLFASVFRVINTGKNRDSGNDAKLAKKIAEVVLAKLYVFAKEKDIESKTIIELVYRELKKANKSFADMYIAYSDYRIKIALSFARSI